MKCDFCGREEDLPFTCRYCGGTFCGEHRLPENHACKGDLTSRVVAAPITTRSWDGSAFLGNGSGRASPYFFSAREIRDIVVAWAVLALAFTILIFRRYGGFIGGGPIQTFVIAVVAVGSGFVLHELMHKFTAERYGYWAEFRMWVTGVVLALITSSVGFIFAAPGATYINAPAISEKQNGIVSLAGPMTNVVIAFVFLLVGIVGTGIAADIGGVGFSVNLSLALFNMIPILPLDGAKVFRWSKAIWSAVFFPLLILVVFGLGLFGL